MTPSSIKASKGDTLIRVNESGTKEEILVLSWGKKRATIINKIFVGTHKEAFYAHNIYLNNGVLEYEEITRKNQSRGSYLIK